MKKNIIPERKDIPNFHKWNLCSLFESDEKWEAALKAAVYLIDEAASYKGRLLQSSEILLEALKAFEEADKKIELIYNYASLQHHADGTDTEAAQRLGKVETLYTDFNTKLSFFYPEIQGIPDEKINNWIAEKSFDDYRIFIKKLLRLKPYILSEKEERIISLQGQIAQTPYKTFSALTNIDMNQEFGSIETENGQEPLTESTYIQFLHNKDRNIRKNAYRQYYSKYKHYQNTIASLYAGSVNQDIFSARARGYKSSLEQALFSNKVPKTVYTNLIECVHKNLPVLHNYYELRRKILGLDCLYHYDVYVPLIKKIEVKTTYEEAVEICKNALSPLGKEYTDRLCSGLLNGWADRYENKGKRSGAFSSGAYTGYPYILLNYKENVLRDVYTLAHEGGHSMHTWYSSHNNPYMHYNYTIFEAEVASTFNEELVFQYMFNQAEDENMKAYLLSMRIDDIIATLYRQTMFAEYELKTHELAEMGSPLTPELLRKTYRELLIQYFGSKVKFEEESDLEAFRIPHFYGAFYVYKYATGLSASLALSERVISGGIKEREDYFNFLKSGGSRFPIESLKVAGVDMESPVPVQAALDKFTSMTAALEKLLKI